MKAIRIPLEPHSRFHFGEFKIDGNTALSSTSEFYHSDSLFSALVNTWAQLFGNANSLVEDFKADQLKISSLYYYVRKNDFIVYLLPKPIFLDLFSPRDGKHKMRARVKFISKGVWEQGFDMKAWTDSNDFIFINNQSILITTNEFNHLGITENDWVYKVIDSPKSPIRKKNETDSIYYRADVEIGYNIGIEIGFYFLFDCQRSFDINRFQSVLNVLSYSGIGGDKNSSGRTLKESVWEDFQIRFSCNGAYNQGFCNLSLINPENIMDLENIRYSLTKLRGGGHNGYEVLKVVRMIREGALLTTDNLNGRLVPIGTDIEGNTVLRNGKALIIPIRFI